MSYYTASSGASAQSDVPSGSSTTVIVSRHTITGAYSVDTVPENAVCTLFQLTNLYWRIQEGNSPQLNGFHGLLAGTQLRDVIVGGCTTYQDQLRTCLSHLGLEEAVTFSDWWIKHYAMSVSSIATSVPVQEPGRPNTSNSSPAMQAWKYLLTLPVKRAYALASA
jgi:hypothetical protein